MKTWESERVAAMDRRLGGYAVFFLTVLGIWFLVGPLAPTWSGYGALTDALGGETVLFRCAVAFLFLYFAGLVREKNELRHTLHGMIDMIHRQLYGADYKEVRATVDVLIESLESERETVRQSAREALSQLTGEDFGPERQGWEDWWRKSRATFRRAGASAAPEGKPGS